MKAYSRPGLRPIPTDILLSMVSGLLYLRPLTSVHLLTLREDIEGAWRLAFEPITIGSIAGATPPLFTHNLDHPSSTSNTNNSRYIYLHQGCRRTLKRPGDLDRHLKDHQPGSKEFDCPAPRCLRKSTNGFTRMDKMIDHWTCKHQ